MSSYLRHPLRRGLLICAVALLLSALTATGTQARPGDPDPSFGSGGHTVASIFNRYAAATSMAVDSQGRIVVAGFYTRPFALFPVVARFNPDGSLDRSFGEDGWVQPRIGASARIDGIAVDRADRILLGGDFESPAFRIPPTRDFFVARLLPDGEPDSGFADKGVIRIDGGETGDYASDLVLDKDGRILLSGSSAGWFTAVRVTEDGLPDPDFGGDGILSSELGAPGSAGTIAIDSQGRIVLAGSAILNSEESLAVARLGPGGSPDVSFDRDGWASLGPGGRPNTDFAADIAIDSADRLVLVGGSGDYLRGDALAWRMAPDGSFDGSFDGDGKFALDLPGSAAAVAVAIDGSGRILLAGTRRDRVKEETGQFEDEDAFLLRLDPDSPLDSSFGTAGVVRETYGAATGLARASAVTVDSAGRYLIAGDLRRALPSGFALARYLSADQPPVEQVLPRCRGKRATIVGTPGRDRLPGTSGRDVIVALGGNDRIRSLAGKNLICAGAGRDLVQAGGGNDKVFGGPGRDRLFGQAGRDQLRGGPGTDRLFGGPGRDSLRGGSKGDS